MTKRYYRFSDTHRTIRGRKQKYCTKCNLWKAERKFSRDRAKRDGLKSRCKACDSAYGRDPRWRKRNIREYLGFELRHRIIRGVREKLCSRCKQWKDEDGFYRSRGAKDGLAGWCKECERRRSHERYERNRKGERRLRPYEDRHRIVDGVREKLCTKCRKWKKESEYYTDRARKDGLTGLCQKCSDAATAKSRR